MNNKRKNYNRLLLNFIDYIDSVEYYWMKEIIANNHIDDAKIFCSKKQQWVNWKDDFVAYSF